MDKATVAACLAADLLPVCAFGADRAYAIAAGPPARSVLPAAATLRKTA